MASRYQDLVFTKTVPAGSSEQFGLSIPYLYLNVAKIKILASEAAEDWSFTIYNNTTYTDADIAYRTITFQGNLVDPIWGDGVTVVEKNQGFVAAYEDKSLSLQMFCKLTNAGANPITFNGTITIDTTPGSATGDENLTGVPEGLVAKAYAVELVITSGVTAKKNNATIDLGEFRAIFVSGTGDLPYYDLRTVAEGGTFVADGITKIQVNVDSANADGAQYIFTSAAAGRWYYAWRLRNTVGWSNWTDGNIKPTRVSQYVDTRTSTAADIGPPEDWDVYLEDGPSSNTVVVRATRPKINGDIINWMAVQIMDADVGTWVDLLTGSDAGHLRWDGRSNDYTLNSATRNQIHDDDGAGWGTAAVGDLVLLDVRGGGEVWNEQHCQWGVIKAISGAYITINGFFRPQAYTQMRLIIVKPPWAWTTGGYGQGMWPQKKEEENLFIGDTGTREFVTTPIVIPATCTNPEARVWFENNYSRADSNLTHSEGRAGLPSARLWTNFNDTRWWIPIYGQQEWATLVIDLTTGSMTITAVSPRPTKGCPGNFTGVKGRFAVYPDLTGVLKFRVKYESVEIPQLTFTGSDAAYEGTCVGIFHERRRPYAPFNFDGITWGNYRDNSTIRFQAPDIGWAGAYYPTVPSPVVNAYSDVSRPAAGYTLEMRYGFATPPSAIPGHQHFMCCTTAEYRLGGSGGWTALAGIGTTATPDNAAGAIYPFVPLVGLLETYQTYTKPTKVIQSYTAKLTEFEVIQGLIRQNRLIVGNK